MIFILSATIFNKDNTSINYRDLLQYENEGLNHDKTILSIMTTFRNEKNENMIIKDIIEDFLCTSQVLLLPPCY
jgi:hypothetical protein